MDQAVDEGKINDIINRIESARDLIYNGDLFSVSEFNRFV